MRKYLLGGFSVIVLLAVGLFFTERGRDLLFLGIVNFFKPTEPFDPSQTAPDYNNRSNMDPSTLKRHTAQAHDALALSS